MALWKFVAVKHQEMFWVKRWRVQPNVVRGCGYLGDLPNAKTKLKQPKKTVQKSKAFTHSKVPKASLVPEIKSADEINVSDIRRSPSGHQSIQILMERLYQIEKVSRCTSLWSEWKAPVENSRSRPGDLEASAGSFSSGFGSHTSWLQRQTNLQDEKTRDLQDRKSDSWRHSWRELFIENVVLICFCQAFYRMNMNAPMIVRYFALQSGRRWKKHFVETKVFPGFLDVGMFPPSFNFRAEQMAWPFCRDFPLHFVDCFHWFWAGFQVVHSSNGIIGKSNLCKKLLQKVLCFIHGEYLDISYLDMPKHLLSWSQIDSPSEFPPEIGWGMVGWSCCSKTAWVSFCGQRDFLRSKPRSIL